MKALRITVVVVLLQLMLSISALADLQPSEIAIIVARGSRGSEQLAEYYVEQRGVPAKNICAVVMPREETISHEKWRWSVRPEIRKWLEDNDPDHKLRCLVTTWDVPLRINRDEADNPSLTRYREFLEGERAKRIALLGKMEAEFAALAPGNSEVVAQQQADDNTGAADEDETKQAQLEQLQQRMEAVLQETQARIRQLPDPEAQKQAAATLQRYATAVGGLQVLLESLNKHIQSNATPAAGPLQAEFSRLQGMLMAYAELKQQFDRAAAGIERDSTQLTVLTRSSGMIASLKWIDEQLKATAKNETNSSFDSELSLVRWPDDYQLLRWQPNYLRPEYDNSQLRDSFSTLMVARIDAPTLTLAKGLIDTAIKIEKQGLEGKVYLDARGIGKLDQTQVASGSYADFDRALLMTAKGLREQTMLEVTLDEKPELFQPGDCPDAALYCGWYSLGKYVDAFDWAPGAVAYHLASGEATTLHNKESQVWCKRLLEDGVCATIGPTFEPYLMAFPRPNEFFSVLIQGELSLVECYYRTKPFNSWMMILVGDPLYRPFANRPVIKDQSEAN